MTALEMMIDVMKNNVLEAIRSGNQNEISKTTKEYLKTIQGLDKKTRKVYYGLEMFLEIVNWYQNINKTKNNGDSSLTRIIDKYSDSEEINKKLPDWISKLQTLLDSVINNQKEPEYPVALFESFSKVCTVSFTLQAKGKKPSLEGSPALKKIGLVLLELGLGLIYCSALFGIYYLFYSGKVNIFKNGSYDFLATFPSKLVIVFVYAFYILNGILAVSVFHFAVCGIGKVHYVFGTRGYMFKFILTLIIAMPIIAFATEPFFSLPQLMILPFVYISGRGFRRKVSGELHVVQAIS